jgi:predicted RecB family nuclease
MRKRHNLINYLQYLAVSEQPAIEVSSSLASTLHNEGDIVVKATLMAGNLEAYCDALTSVKSSFPSGGSIYEPTIVVDTYSISKEQELELAFAGFVIGQIYKKLPFSGHLVNMDGKVNCIRLEQRYKELKRYLDPLREWIAKTPETPPSVILNKHCSTCQFRMLCGNQAEKRDDLSLLDRMTPKLIQRYQKKGIFTINQLSYTFKPRRSKKRTGKKIPVFKLELQALAIRTNKIYIQELPALQRRPVELFLDIEGIPDQHGYYLIGLIISQNGQCSYYSFWGDTVQDEGEMWHRFLEKIEEYPDSPIYHYGAYEPTSLEKLAARYQTECEHIRQRLVNVIAFIYGKVYFPVRSNGLKDI